MSKFIRLAAFSCVLLLMLGCDNVEHLDPIKDYKDAKINGFEMRIPRYFKRDAELDPQATLAYSLENKERDFHLVLLEEDKAIAKNATQRSGYLKDNGGLANAYYRMYVAEMGERAEMEEKATPRDTVVNALPQTRGELMEDVSMVADDPYYFIAVIEGTEKMYVITCWTSWFKNDHYRETINHMLNSFRLMP